MIAIDPRCPWVQIISAPDGPGWRITSFVFQDTGESGGNHNVYATLLKADGSPAVGINVFHGWPTFQKPDDVLGSKTDQSGSVNWPLWVNGFDPAKQPHGPYWVMPEMNLNQADRLEGMGLPLNRHVNYVAVWQWTDSNPPPPPPSSTLKQQLQQIDAELQQIIGGLT